MSEQTIEAPPLRGPAIAPRRDQSTEPSRSSLRWLQRGWELISSHPWISGAVLLLAISTVIVRWASVRPGYDPYGWLVWGHLTVHLKLNTNGAPSWKPLPFLFTVPYAVIGHYAMWAWMITAVAISLAGAVFAWRIAFRLTPSPPERRYASYIAGFAAACAVLGIQNYAHFVLSAQSDPMIVSLCLAAIDCQLSGRRRWAFWMWVLAALGRPEVWPFLGLYTVWLWREDPELRRMLVGGILLLPAMWFGIPALTAKSPFIAGDIALHSPRELHSNKFIGTIDRYLALQSHPVELMALVAVAFAFLRRNLLVLALAAGTALWVLIECAFAIHGWAAVPRYVFEPAAVTGVLAGIALGFIVLELPALLSRIGRWVSPAVAGWGTAAAVLTIAGVMAPTAVSRLRVERVDLRHERVRAAELNRLSVVVNRLGGASRILACGQPNIPIGYQSTLAWDLGVNVGILYYAPNSINFHMHPHPVVSMYPLSNGWKVVAGRVNFAKSAHQRAVCARMRLTYRS